MSKQTLRGWVVTAVMGAIGAVLMYFEFSVPLIPAFVKLDFSELPALVTAFGFGPFYGVGVCLIKNLLHVFASQSAGVGELANFLLGAVFCLVAGALYRSRKTRRRAMLSCLLACVAMALISLPVNYWITYPFYTLAYFGGDTAPILEMYRTIWPGAGGLWHCLLIFNLPFTLIKGLADSALCMVVYKPLSHVLKRKT